MSDKTTSRPAPCTIGEPCYVCDGSCGADLDECIVNDGIIQTRREAAATWRAKEAKHGRL